MADITVLKDGQQIITTDSNQVAASVFASLLGAMIDDFSKPSTIEMVSISEDTRVMVSLAATKANGDPLTKTE